MLLHKLLAGGHGRNLVAERLGAPGPSLLSVTDLPRKPGIGSRFINRHVAHSFLAAAEVTSEPFRKGGLVQFRAVIAQLNADDLVFFIAAILKRTFDSDREIRELALNILDEMREQFQVKAEGVTAEVLGDGVHYQISDTVFFAAIQRQLDQIARDLALHGAGTIYDRAAVGELLSAKANQGLNIQRISSPV